MNRWVLKGLLVLSSSIAVLGAAQHRAAPKGGPPKAAPVGGRGPSAPFQPLSVDPVNPHYLRFRGRPVVLITSGEHYGAVSNADFDYVKYLDTLHENGMNLARIFNGTYVEPLDTLMFAGGDQNTLAPRTGRYMAPWARTGEPGYTGGGRKFDVTRWDEDYFTRLKTFVSEAGKRGIAVEVTLFSTNYGSGKIRWGGWNLNPLNAANNINGIGEITWDRFNTLDDKRVVAAQDDLVRKTVAALTAFDNIYYEVCNEPYYSGAGVRQTREWLNHIIATIQSAEAALPNKHLIAENVPPDYAAARDANPAVSIYNFHAPQPAFPAAANWNLRKPLAFDSTVNGCATLERRREAWAFLLSGGAVYNNLDLSFATDDPLGKGDLVHCEGIRYALRVLAQFLSGLDISHMQPDHSSAAQWPQGASEVYLFDNPGQVYAVYFKGGNDTRSATLLLEVPPGRYQAEWLNPRTGDPARDAPFPHPGGAVKIQTPDFNEDLAMKLVRVGDLPEVMPVNPRKTRSPARKTR